MDNNLKVLALGDVIGKCGRKLLGTELFSIVANENVDIVIANGENSAGGLGINSKTYRELCESGVDIVTLGNHLWDKKEIYDFIEEKKIVRPLNYPGKTTPGSGVRIFDVKDGKIAVISLLGRVYMPKVISPFTAMDKVITDLHSKGIKNIFVDFHAEATSEKIALGFYLDGRVSAVFGTHTHVQTNDDRVLSEGTGYITDLGMVGDRESVIGIDKDIIIERFLDSMPKRFKVTSNRPMMNGVFFNIDMSTGKCKSVKKLNKVY